MSHVEEAAKLVGEVSYSQSCMVFLYVIKIIRMMKNGIAVKCLPIITLANRDTKAKSSLYCLLNYLNYFMYTQ